MYSGGGSGGVGVLGKCGRVTLPFLPVLVRAYFIVPLRVLKRDFRLFNQLRPCVVILFFLPPFLPSSSVASMYAWLAAPSRPLLWVNLAFLWQTPTVGADDTTGV